MVGNKRNKPEPKFSAKKDKSVLVVCAAVLCLLFLIISFLPVTGKIEEHKYIIKLEQRISDLEKRLEGTDITPDKIRELSVQGSKMESFINNYNRLDASVSLKTNLLASRIDKLQLQIDTIKQPVQKRKVVAEKKKTAKKKVVRHAPEKLYHTVKKGETFYSISRKYGLSLGQIRVLNGFSEKTIIYPGQKIIVK